MPRRGSRLKGPVFKSWQDARPTTRQVMQWVPHSRLRQACRNLRHACGPVFKLVDEASVLARKRCVADTSNEPEPEYASLHLMHAAWEAHDSTGEPWALCMNYLLDKFSEQKGLEVASI